MSESRISPETLAEAQSLLIKLGGLNIPSKITQQTVASNSPSPSSQSSSVSTSFSVSSMSSRSSSGSTMSISSAITTTETKEEEDGPDISKNDLAAIRYLRYLKSQNAGVLNAAYYLAMTIESLIQGRARICALLKFAKATHPKAEESFNRLSEKMRNEVERLTATYRTLEQFLLADNNAPNLKVPLDKAITAKASLKNAIITREGTATGILRVPKVISQKVIKQRGLNDDYRALAALASTSVYARSIVQAELDQLGVRKLFKHIVEGEMAEVTKMLEASPHLALVEWDVEKIEKTAEAKEEKKVITNKAGQRILAQGKTAYQIALGEEDTQMAAFIKSCIAKVASEEEADRQYHAQFPEGWEEAEEKAWKPLFTQLTTLNDAIRDSVVGDIVSSGHPEYKLTLRAGCDVEKELNLFTSLLDAKRNEIAKTGRHFNPKLLIQGFEEYDNRYVNEFGNNSRDPRALLSWQRGIGSVEKYLLPANYWQAFSDGIPNTTRKMQENVPQGRRFIFEVWSHVANNWRQVPFSEITALVGLDMAVYGSNVGLALSRSDFMWAMGRGISKFMSSKNHKHGELMPRDLRQRASAGCLIQ